jgi:hypothetical protein
MSEMLLLAFLFFFSSIVFWPACWIFHRRQRPRRPQVATFLAQIIIFGLSIAGVLYCDRNVADFHHLLIFVYPMLVVVNVAFWITSFLIFGGKAQT